MERTGFLRFSILVVSLAALTWLLMTFARILVPFIFAVFVYSILVPVSDYLVQKLKVKYGVAVAITVLGWGLGSAGMGAYIAGSVKNTFKSADLYQQRLIDFYAQTLQIVADWGFEIGPEQINANLAKIPVFSWFSQFSGGFLGLMSDLALVGIFLLFMLAGGRPSDGSFLKHIQKGITRYVLVKTGTSLVTGLLVGGTLALIGVEMAPLFGMLAYLLNFIPTIGSLVATTLPLPVALLQFGLSPQLVLVLAIPGLIQFALGSVLEPKVMGQSLDLHPITVLLALMFWGLVWGVIGMFLAVPIMVVLKIILEKFPHGRPVAELFSGRW